MEAGTELQEVGALFGTPIGESIVEYAAKVRVIVGQHQRLTRVAKAAQDFCAELCEDSPDVPQPQLKELHAALERWEDRAATTAIQSLSRTEELVKASGIDWADPNIECLVGLLTREGRHSGVWFADSLIRAAILLDEARAALASHRGEGAARQA